ncbi:MAG: type II toxin-antitoxin system prevent-host-death family antitoxin [Glaciimonas sp.]|nr:type II toxin-antitoxin system prevent-host-death family antitoxin [Glaciimonas sp.]
MLEIGSYDAKTRLPELLREVENGQSFVITNRGRAVAMLCPIPKDESNDLAQAIAAMQVFAARPASDMQTMGLIEKGR